MWYTFHDISVQGETATALVTETATFYYTGETEQSVAETTYSVCLINLAGQWYISDASDDGWFDEKYKDDDSFNVKIAISEMRANEIKEAIIESEPPALTRAAANYTIPYKAANAAAYASTYSVQTPASGTTSKDYYNKNYYNWASSGGDCQNFASQCVLAGFSGSNTKAEIDAHILPMDTVGPNTWFGCSSSNSNPSTNSTGSWRHCLSFYSYANSSNNDTDVGLKSTIFTTSGALTGASSASKLIGSIAHVDGYTGAYTHAIVLTHATGTARNKIYFSAHTGDAKYILLADWFPSCSLRCYIPEYMRVSSPTTDRLVVTMDPPIAVNTSKTITCSTTTKQYRFTISITTPSGANTQYSSTVESNTFTSPNYKFAQTGLYTITAYSKRTSTSTAQSVTYTIRVY